ncbi:hypothetical protein [Nitriliruptor alkaliphilus]|uniref:hypothetical protein n=1 Tax=Nitriliruptor alkaliphilus TaxID=427918 RepID=UPI00069695FF|nr:hypothetical protein [Nitriliruptor alkaliphilus]
MRSIQRTLAIAAVASLVLGACTSDDGNGNDPTDGDDPSAAAADGEAGDGDGDEPAVDGTEDAGEDDTGNGEDEPEGPTSIDLDESIEHPNGSTMTLTGLEIEDNGIFVSFELYNGHRQTVTLALYGEDDRVQQFVQLIDDTGRSYAYQASSDNPQLELDPNSDMSARIGFLGRLPADATSVTLRFNYNLNLNRPVDGPSQAPNSLYPTFVFEGLPLPGR